MNVSVNYFLVLCVTPVTDWQSVHAVPPLLPYGSWDRFPRDPEMDKQNKVDGWTENPNNVSK